VERKANTTECPKVHSEGDQRVVMKLYLWKVDFALLLFLISSAFFFVLLFNCKVSERVATLSDG